MTKSEFFDKIEEIREKYLQLGEQVGMVEDTKKGSKGYPKYVSKNLHYEDELKQKEAELTRLGIYEPASKYVDQSFVNFEQYEILYAELEVLLKKAEIDKIYVLLSSIAKLAINNLRKAILRDTSYDFQALVKNNKETSEIEQYFLK